MGGKAEAAVGKTKRTCSSRERGGPPLQLLSCLKPAPCRATHRGDIGSGNTDRNRPPWPGTTVTLCMRYLATGGPGKEHGTNEPLLRGRIPEGSTHPANLQDPPHRNPSWLRAARRTLSQNEGPETSCKLTPPPSNPDRGRRVAGQCSWAPFPSCSPPGRPFPVKPLALPSRVSPQIIHL